MTELVRRGRARLSCRDDAGVTLIELLVSIIIMGIIMASLGAALWTYFRTTNDTTNRVSESHDAQIAAVYWAQDVASVGVHGSFDDGFPLEQSIEQNVGATQGLHHCGNSGTPSAIVRLAWDDPNSANNEPKTIVVAYVVETVSGDKQLHRIECANGSSTESSDIVVVRNLDSAGVTCSTQCEGNGNNVPEVPEQVTMTLKIKVAGSSDNAYTVNLTAQRRQT